MQFILRERIGRFHRWRRCPRCLDFQITRLYTPSSNHQASKPFAKPKRSRYVFPPAAPCKSRPAPSKVPQARQTEGSRSRGSERKLHDWVTEHRYIVYTFAVFVSGTTFCSFALQRVPITGRMQLDFIPSWVARRMAKSARKNEDDLRENLEDCSLRGDHPAMQGVNLIFERLVRASGLGDREWEFRVVLAPSKYLLRIDVILGTRHCGRTKHDEFLVHDISGGYDSFAFSVCDLSTSSRSPHCLGSTICVAGGIIQASDSFSARSLPKRSIYSRSQSMAN